MLIRCARCLAVFSVQEGLSGPVQRAFRVECGRCQAIFDTQSGQLPEAPRTPPPRRIPTPVPFQRPVTAARPGGSPLAVERHASPAEMADTGLLRPAISGPVARHNPLTRGGAVAIALLAVVALVAMLVLGRARGGRESAAAVEQGTDPDRSGAVQR